MSKWNERISQLEAENEALRQRLKAHADEIKACHNVLMAIRDSTFRSALQLRAIASRFLEGV